MKIDVFCCIWLQMTMRIINPLVSSILNIERLAKILISINEVNISQMNKEDGLKL